MKKMSKKKSKELFVSLLNQYLDLEDLATYLLNTVQLSIDSKPIHELFMVEESINKLVNETFDLVEADDKMTTVDWWLDQYRMEGYGKASYEDSKGNMVDLTIKTPEELYDFMMDSEEIE